MPITDENGQGDRPAADPARAAGPARVRPAPDADERTQLLGWLDLQRALVHWKCAGVAEADAHRSVLVTSPLMTVAGLVSHLRWVEHCWFQVLFLGGDPATNPQFDENADDADWQVDDRPLAALLDEYAAECAASNAVVAAHALEDRGRHPQYSATDLTLRWILLHMLEETARHVGHLDTVREQIDGSTGYY